MKYSNHLSFVAGVFGSFPKKTNV